MEDVLDLRQFLRLPPAGPAEDFLDLRQFLRLPPGGDVVDREAAPPVGPLGQVRGSREVALRDMLAEAPRGSARRGAANEEAVALRAFLRESRSLELVEAAKRGDRATILAVLAWGCDVDFAVDGPEGEERWTALFYATRGGHVAALEALLAHGADVRARDVDGWTALHVAAEAGRGACVRELLARGADANDRDHDALTPLIYAALGGHVDCCEALVGAGAQIDGADDRGWTPALYAARNDRAAALARLASLGAALERAARPPAPRATDRTGGPAPPPGAFAVYLEHGTKPGVLPHLLRCGARPDTRGAARFASKAPKAWDKVDEIHRFGGWPNFVRRHRTRVERLVAGVLGARLPDAVHTIICDYYAPPGGSW